MYAGKMNITKFKTPSVSPITKTIGAKKRNKRHPKHGLTAMSLQKQMNLYFFGMLYGLMKAFITTYTG